MKAVEIIKAARKAADPKRAVASQRFFKTAKGEYGEGDIFWGLAVPQSRLIAKGFSGLALLEIKKLLYSKIRELRLIGLLILVETYEKSDSKKKIVDFYIKHLRQVNNWDLVDLSSYKILGDWLLKKPTAILDRLAVSKNLWERRVAVVSTFAHIRQNDFKPTLRLAKKLLRDNHDLMHKAVGWMLREVGKRDEKILKKFLDERAPKMPRTALRYAIERLPTKLRSHYLKRV